MRDHKRSAGSSTCFGVSGAALGFQPASWLSTREKLLSASLYSLFIFLDFLVILGRTAHPRSDVVLLYGVLLAASFPAGMSGRQWWDDRKSDVDA